ncbi:MAG: SulP family inorganic anion transporter [Hyphomicrobiales bacterium]|nr:SulP family inorganic anion transporter [Hyphomicrobiales bacterium]MDE2115246.1 SulP family inorganic anion transporter [Hyphomicrobiales bacterium]
MASHDSAVGLREKPGFFEAFTPKLITVWREGYTLANLRADALAGLAVAIVALPLSMAIAIACGARPETGLYTSIIGGFVLSAFGGSRYQIGGPAGAFIVVVSMALQHFGANGFLVAVMFAGVLLMIAGFLKLGTYVRYVPHPVIVGFTAAIAIVIFSSQIKYLFGLSVPHEPAAIAPKIMALAQAYGTFSLATTLVSLACIGIIVGLRAWRPHFPGFLAAVAFGAIANLAFKLKLATLGTAFGHMPRSLPLPHLPHVDFSLLAAVAPTALTFAMLGSIESLLSAVVADGMTGRKHRSNGELVAQGLANLASAAFGGLAVTGVVARTAANIRAHAHGPLAGMFHAAFILIFLMFAAPATEQIPLCALAAVLAVVCWNMADRANFFAILKHDRGEALLLMVTFLLTLFTDLTIGITAGVTLGALMFMHRMAEMTKVSVDPRGEDEDSVADAEDNNDDILVTRIAGPFFFGAANSIGSVLERLGDRPKAFIVDLASVPMADVTGARTLQDFVTRVRKRGASVYLINTQPKVEQILQNCGLAMPFVTYARNEAEARKMARAAFDAPAPMAGIA